MGNEMGCEIWTTADQEKKRLVRSATRDDIARIVLLVKSHHDEQKEIGNPNFNWQFDPARVSMTIAGAIITKGWLCLYGGSNLLLANVVLDDPFGAPPYAMERIIRGNLDLLIPVFEKWAQDQGCRTTVLSTTYRHEGFERLYGKFGYALAETVYAKAL
jgi:hypothetical protein